MYSTSAAFAALNVQPALPPPVAADPTVPAAPIATVDGSSTVVTVDDATVRAFVLAKGFKLFPKEGYGSVSLNCFANTLNLDLGALNKILKSKHQLVIDGGYGKLKGKTFRISNMGDETDETIAAMLKSLESALAETPKAAA